ncbi:MAG: matrixin family metalloprotease [Nitrosopumilus sp.]
MVRHELGHSFGLAHSTAPEDLMAPMIVTEFPYISDCDLDAIIFLYNGGESGQVVCKK